MFKKVEKMKDEEIAEEYTQNLPFVFETEVVQRIVKMYAKQAFLAGLNAKKKQFEKVEYTLKKIIETVQNDKIDEYGARLILIKDFAYECLEEIEK